MRWKASEEPTRHILWRMSSLTHCGRSPILSGVRGPSSDGALIVASDSGNATATKPPSASVPAAAHVVLHAFNRTSKRAFALAHRITGDPDLAEDLVQVAFTRCWEKRRSWRDPDHLPALLLATTRNLAINAKRDDQVHARALESSLPRPSGRTPAVDLEQAELEQAVVVLIRTLPPRRRRVFVLRVCHGFSTPEVATLLGIRPQAVANYLAAARKQPKHSLKEGGWV